MLTLDKIPAVLVDGPMAGHLLDVPPRAETVPVHDRGGRAIYLPADYDEDGRRRFVYIRTVR